MRKKEIKIRLTESELAKLNQKVRSTNLSREAYCRAVLNGSAVRQSPPVDVPYLLRAMRQNGNNLNQALTKLNSAGEADLEEFRKGAAEVRDAVKLVVQAYTDAR